MSSSTTPAIATCPHSRTQRSTRSGRKVESNFYGVVNVSKAAKWAVAGFSIGLAQEIASFGVQVTVLEPGGMRTDWAGSSMTIPLPSGPYQPTIGAFADLLRGASGHEPTNTRRVAQVVHDLAGQDDAPVRLLLGADAVPMAQQAAQELAASDEAWREVSLSVSDRILRPD
jgi:NAD(P)-dependent dehydrogenase (short-subunit alcohol dehydrogenase family)